MSPNIEFFGEFVVKKFLNVANECVQGLCRGIFKSPGHHEYQELIHPLPDEQKRVIEAVTKHCAEGALNDFLYHLDKEMRKKNPRIQLVIDGIPINLEGSKGLHSMLRGQEGWLARYGKTNDKGE